MQTDWFKKRMREIGATQESLSREWGRDRNSISRIIRGDQVMDVQEAAQFAKALRVTLLEVVMRAIAQDGEPVSIGEGAAADAVPLRYRIAAMESGAGSYDMTDRHLFCAPPPKWRATPNAFAAEVSDDSADRYYPAGTILFCVPPAQLGRPLRTGERCVYLGYTDTISQGKPFEARFGILSAAPDGAGAMLIGASRDHTKATTAWLERQAPRGALHEGAAAFDRRSDLLETLNLTPQSHDKAEIVGIVVSTYSVIA